MNEMKPALVSLRAKRIGILIGLSLLAAMPVHADLDGSTEPSITSADPGTSIDSANGTGVRNNRQAPMALFSANGTGSESDADSAESANTQTFAELSELDDAQSIGCESAEGSANDICGSVDSESAPVDE